MFHSLSKEVTVNLSRRIAFPFTFLLVESLVLYLFTSFHKKNNKSSSSQPNNNTKKKREEEKKKCEEDKKNKIIDRVEVRPHIR